MSKAPLMPMATAVWLVENTTLTFKQIANYCKLHEVEVQGIADGEVAKGIVGYNPIMSGQLTREEIKLSSEDENRQLNLKTNEVEIQGIADGDVAKGIVGYNPIMSGQLTREEIELSSKDESRPLNIKTYNVNIENEEKKIKKYVPLSKRQDKPDSALWLIKQHSILKDSQIAKLVGITKNSVTSIRSKNYWNFNNLNPKDPVAMGLFSQKDLIEAIEKAERRIKREKKLKEKVAAQG